jgi:hypothetical protein
VQPSLVWSAGKQSRGVTLLYGFTPRHPFFGELPKRALTIAELLRPDDLLVWKRVPRGYLSISPGESSGSGGSYLSWTGYVLEHGVYVTIETRLGERAVVAAARALRPAP